MSLTPTAQGQAQAQPQPRGTVLVTGAGGYLGSRLVPRLLAAGWTVRAAFTDIAKSRAAPWRDRVSCIELDVTNPAQLAYAVRRVDAVLYLVHSLAGADFAARDRLAADTTAAAITEAGVGRVVYVSGIVPPVDPAELSEHLTSRLDVEQRLGLSSASVTTLRAAIVIGAGSTSFEMMRQIAERLRVHALPPWMLTSRVQPIAVADLLEVVVGALGTPLPTIALDVGGPDRLTYRRLLELYSRIAGLSRPQVLAPFLPTAVVGRLAAQFTDIPAPTVQALVDSLQHDMVCRDDDFRALLPQDYALTSVDDAIRRALAGA